MEIDKRYTKVRNTNKITKEEIQQLEQQLGDLINDYDQTNQNFSQLNKVGVTIGQSRAIASQSDLLM